MSDFHQSGPVATIHDLGTSSLEALESALVEATRDYKIGLLLPVTAADAKAPAFARIVDQVRGADYVEQICVVLGRAPDEGDYRFVCDLIEPLGSRAEVLWTNGEEVQSIYRELTAAGFPLDVPGKGRSVWTGLGYFLADPRLEAIALHDCDIVDYDRLLLARLCLPMAMSGLDFEFTKAFYHRGIDRLYGRVSRLLVAPVLQSLLSILGNDPLLLFLHGFRYPLSGEFCITTGLARSNRIPGDWGLEIGVLAEVFRNTSVKRVCQVDLCVNYEHKHQPLALDDPDSGLRKMASDILTTLFRVLATRGTSLDDHHVAALRASYLRQAQDVIRQYHADARVNGLAYDRSEEERIVEAFAHQIQLSGEAFRANPVAGAELPNWARVLTDHPRLPERLRAAAGRTR